MTSKNPYTMTAEEFADYRKFIGLSQQQMAELLGVTTQAVRFWEESERRVPPTTVRLLWLFKKYPQLIAEF